jgi:hypothetical protein
LLAFFAEPPQSLLELGAPAVFSLLFLRQFHGYPGLSLVTVGNCRADDPTKSGRRAEVKEPQSAV